MEGTISDRLLRERWKIAGKQRAAASAEEFVKARQAANDMQEVARKTGLRIESVNARGYRFRKHGVPLEKFAGQGRPVTDSAALKKLAQKV
jgi:hypothetical protein